jgi:hypothetical protein
MAGPTGLPPLPRRPVAAAILAAAMAAVLWWSLPAGWRTIVVSGWDAETVMVVLGAHALFLGAFGWIVRLFWTGRRPGDGG